MGIFAKDNYELSNNSDFILRVEMLLLKVINNVIGEDQGSMTLDKFNKRHDFAYKCLLNSNNYIVTMCRCVANNPTIDINSSDGDIEFTINSLVDDFAGVKSTD